MGSIGSLETLACPRFVLLGLLALGCACGTDLGRAPATAPAEVASAPVLDLPEAVDLESTTATRTALRVAVISDLNGPYGSVTYSETVHAAIARVSALAPDLVLATGDLVAGQRRGLDYGAMWNGFHEAVSGPLTEAGIPLAVTPGNHDASGYRIYAEERAIFVEQWTAPGRQPELHYLDDAHFPLRYSFIMGPAIFISLDATTVGPLGPEQMSWLAEQLDAGRDKPVKVIYGHVPLYPFAEGREREVIGEPELERLLLEHEVTLFVSGHHHAYYPGRRGALRLVSTSCLGAGPRPLLGQDEPASRSVLWMEIDEGGIGQLHALSGDRFDLPVARAGLPEQVGAPGMVVTRDDL